MVGAKAMMASAPKAAGRKAEAGLPVASQISPASTGVATAVE